MTDNKLKYSELAKCLQVNVASVSVAVSRGNLLAGPYKTIDIDDPVNKAWIENQKQRGKTFDLNRIITKQTPQQHEADDTQDNEIIDDILHSDDDEKSKEVLKKLLLRERKLKVQKLEKENRLRQLEIDKKSGDLIPVDAVTSVFLYSVETFKNKYLQEAKSISTLMVKMMDGTHDDLIETQKQMTEIINENYREVKSQLIDGIDGIIEEYKEVRSRGEKK